jgi:hypothetical protein
MTVGCGGKIAARHITAIAPHRRLGVKSSGGADEADGMRGDQAGRSASIQPTPL